MAGEDDVDVVLEVDRGDVASTRLLEEPRRPLVDGEVRVRIDRFALTANNVTYAVAGDMLGYWDFFPAEAPWGRVPTMGWADVVESANPDVPTGGRYYGWYPMAGAVATTVSRVDGGLRDDAPHRRAHAPVYRRWAATEDDPWYDPERWDDVADAEDRHALLRGLFLTGFLADASLGDRTDADGRAYLGADEVIVVSASSKTAIGFARNAAARDGLRVVGATSARNADFVEGLGTYDEVVVYDDLLGGGPAVQRDGARAVVVDMAGNQAVVGALHGAMGGRVLASVFVGKSHHDADDAPIEGGPEVEFFFAPTEVSRRIEAWGQDGYDERTTTALHDFVEDSTRWLQVERRTGPEGVRDAWDDLVAGRVPPSVGIVASVHA